MNNIKSVYVGTEGLIPLDFSRSEYKNVFYDAQDTVLESGWKIEYLVRDDDTRFEIIYIRCSKDNKVGLDSLYHFLDLPGYFIPNFIDENETHIFLEFGKGGILVFSKETIPKVNSYYSYVDYNIDLGQIVHVPERSYSLDTLEVDVIDLNRAIKQPVIFKNKCDLAPEGGCIDSIHFNKNYIQLFATLKDKNDNTKTIQETHIVELKD